MEKRTKEIHYKIAELFGANGTVHLQDAIEGAIKHLVLPQNRLEMLGINAHEGRVLLHPRHHNAVMCLTMSVYEEGTLQPIMGIGPTLKDWPIKQVEPPVLPGSAQTEFLDGYLYFGVWKNHVVFLPTRACGSEELEDHLNWLLRQCPHWPEKALVSLNDRSPAEYRDRKFKHVQALNINVPMQPQAETATDTSTTRTSKVTFANKTLGAIRELISQLGGKLSEDNLMDEDFDPADVQVKLEVTCRKKGLDRSGPLLDVIANSLRHIHTDLVKFKFEDGTELKGSDLKTQKAVRLECSGNLPVPQQADKAIHDFLQELGSKGIIQ